MCADVKLSFQLRRRCKWCAILYVAMYSVPLWVFVHYVCKRVHIFNILDWVCVWQSVSVLFYAWSCICEVK